MKRIWIKRAIIGSILIAIIVAGLGFAGYKWAKQYYYDQLESTIVNRYLEGRDAIGACSYELNPSLLYTSGYIYKSKRNVMGFLTNKDENVRFVDGDHFFYMEPESTIETNGLIRWLSNKENFDYFSLFGDQDMSISSLVKPSQFTFMVVKKTERGFDFIDEHIYGIGFKYLPNVTTINVKETSYNASNKIYSDYSLYNQYISHLLNEKYRDITIKLENVSNDRKYQLLSELRQKYAAPTSEGLYFKNEYYELRPDEYYSYIGREVFEYETPSFGNNFWTLVGVSVITHYSIQEKGTVLENTFLKRTSIAGICLMLVYIVFCAIMNNKKVKS